MSTDGAPGRVARPPRPALLPRLHPSTLRALAWTFVALRRARADLRAHGVRATVAAPPLLPEGSIRGVHALLARLPATCLERAIVLQAWLASQGHRHDVIVGVARGEARSFKAHAWLDYESDGSQPTRYEELMRLPPP